jgi:hypothetical protein
MKKLDEFNPYDAHFINVKPSINKRPITIWFEVHSEWEQQVLIYLYTGNNNFILKNRKEIYLRGRDWLRGDWIYLNDDNEEVSSNNEWGSLPHPDKEQTYLIWLRHKEGAPDSNLAWKNSMANGSDYSYSLPEPWPDGTHWPTWEYEKLHRTYYRQLDALNIYPDGNNPPTPASVLFTHDRKMGYKRLVDVKFPPSTDQIPSELKLYNIDGIGDIPNDDDRTIVF